MRKLLSSILLSGAAMVANAQQIRPSSSDKIYHEIVQLRHLVNVLYVAAHPDDENTRLLAWLVNDRHIRTGYLSLTRGDGGQNILGSEQGDALGLIRTHELMEARKLDGAEQFFTRAIDFGFSKTFEETFKHWNEDTLTSDAVWVMRQFRPDVVICRFPPNTQAGHGQHAASAIIAANAFKAAGDETKYSNQLGYYKAWQPKRITFNAYRFGSFSTTSEDMFKMKVGHYKPGMGMGTGELAGISRSIHRSQGAGTASVPGVQSEYFRLVDGAPFSASIFDGIDITWNRVNRPDIGDDLKAVADNFDFRSPEKSIPALLSVRKKIEQVKDAYWREQKLAEINQTILDCSGFMAELFAKQPQAVAGASLPFTLHVIARAQQPVVLKSINWLSTGAGTDTLINMAVNADTIVTLEHKITIPANTPLTQPYWLAKAHGPSLFTIPNNTELGMPETPNNLQANMIVNIGDVDFKVALPLSYKKLDPLKGDVIEQLRITPAMYAEFSSNLLVANTNGSLATELRIHANKDIASGTYTISGGAQEGKPVTFSLKAGADTTIPVRFAADPKAVNKEYTITAALSNGGVESSVSQHLIQYSHLPVLQYFTPAKAKVIPHDWKCAVKRVGYIEGAGDLVVSLLKQAGLEVDILKDADLSSAAKLKKYDAIITGIRAVNVEKRMAQWIPVLLDYAKDGGTLVMQYNTLQDLATTNIGPYPFTLANERVTEEDAKVTFTDPKSKLLNYPNKITEKDFDGWVQERGLYFPNKWDDRYQVLLEMHDKGEQPSKGGTLFAKFGKGNYIYTSLSFSRQLPAGNSGAIKLLMNMLSVGK